MNLAVPQLYALEQLSTGHTWIHRLHPVVKLVAAIVFIVTTASFDRYALGRLIPFLFYPTILMAFSATPYRLLLKRLALALPFCLLAGLANLFIDQTAALSIGGMNISYGLVSFCVILLRTYLCVMAVFILIAVTPFGDIAQAMRRIHIPDIFVIIFEMIYRYIGVLVDEAYSMYLAYALRSSGSKGIALKDMGSFLGQLLLRSFDRAERVYNAMKCRGYGQRSDGKNRPQTGGSERTQMTGKSRRPMAGTDILFLAVIIVFCLVFRFFDMNRLLSGLIGGLIYG